MSGMRSRALFALLLAAAASGCGGTRLFSRSADDDLDRPSDESALAATETGPRGRPMADPGAERSLIRPAPAALPIAEHLGRAERALAAQQLTEARQHLEAIVQQQPTHPRAHHLLAVIADLEGRFGDAEHHYHAALQSDRNNAAIVGDLGYSYLLQNQHALAEQYLRQARALDPSHVNAAYNLALLYSRRQDVMGAYAALAEVESPTTIGPILAQLFPGLTPEAFSAALSRGAEGPHLQSQPMVPVAPSTEFATVQSPSGAPLGVDPFSQAAQGPPRYQAAMAVGPQFASATPNAAPEHPGALPNSVPPQAADPVLQPAVPPYGVPSPQSAFLAGAGIEQASAAMPTHETAVPARSPRRWPPAAWPPQSAATNAAVIEQTSASSARPSAGINYLMPRRPPAANAPSSVGVVPPAADPFHDPSASRPIGALAPVIQEPYSSATSLDHQARYSTGPGSSRIVTWSNRNGQSLDAPPLPPTDAAPQSRSEASPISSSAPPIPQAPRTSPGALSGWNGGVYPQPPRQLPGNTPTIFDNPPQGHPGPTTSARTGEPLPFGAGTRQAPPHAGFTIAPANAPPVNPLSGYEAERQQADQYLQQQVEQTYARSPAGYIQPPSANMPRPIHEVPTYEHQTGTGAPLSAGGTPWPVRPAEAPGRSTAPTGPNGSPAPAPYRSAASGTPAILPAYPGVAPQTGEMPYYGPAIVPGR